MSQSFVLFVFFKKHTHTFYYGPQNSQAGFWLLNSESIFQCPSDSGNEWTRLNSCLLHKLGLNLKHNTHIKSQHICIEHKQWRNVILPVSFLILPASFPAAASAEPLPDLETHLWINKFIHTGQAEYHSNTVSTRKLFQGVCQVFTNAAGADWDVGHRLAQPEFLQGSKLRLCLCTTNHNKPQLEKVFPSIWTDSHNPKWHLLLWMSFLFFGSGGITVNAFELEKEKHTFVFVDVNTHARLQRQFSFILTVHGRLTCCNRWLQAAAGGWWHTWVFDFKSRPWKTLPVYFIFDPIYINLDFVLEFLWVGLWVCCALDVL